MKHYWSRAICILMGLQLLMGASVYAESGIVPTGCRKMDALESDRVRASIEIDNETGTKDLSGQAAIAFYQDGRLVSIELGRGQTILAGEKRRITKTAQVPPDEGAYVARAYFWKGLDSMEPLTSEKIQTEIYKTPAREIPAADKILYEEMAACFRYLWNEANTAPNSPGYGIVRDFVNKEEPSAGMEYGSIAATGFALAAIPTGVEYGYITEEEGYARALGTLKTFQNNTRNVQGFFYHFLNMQTGEPYHTDVEISTIDTALLLAGALVCAEYFGDEVSRVFEDIYSRVNWEFMMRRNEAENNNMFYMCAYERTDEETGAACIERQGWWDTCSEQFIMYVLAAGAPNPAFRVEGDVFYNLWYIPAQYGDFQFIRSWGNPLFHYQFSHAFLDFRNTRDKNGIDWYSNSRIAAAANRQYCIDNLENSRTYHQNSWGLSACQTYEGYRGSIAAAPSAYIDVEEQNYGQNNGTIPLYGAAASIVFLPEAAKSAMNYYRNYTENGERKLWDEEYGLIESYNLDREQENERYLRCFYGLNKGITCLQLSNYLDGTVWECFMQNQYVQAGLEAIQISEAAEGAEHE